MINMPVKPVKRLLKNRDAIYKAFIPGIKYRAQYIVGTPGIKAYKNKEKPKHG